MLGALCAAARKAESRGPLGVGLPCLGKGHRLLQNSGKPRSPLRRLTPLACVPARSVIADWQEGAALEVTRNNMNLVDLGEANQQVLVFGLEGRFARAEVPVWGRPGRWATRSGNGWAGTAGLPAEPGSSALLGASAPLEPLAPAASPSLQPR